MKNQQDFTTKVASLFLIVLFLGNNLIASVKAIVTIPPRYETNLELTPPLIGKNQAEKSGLINQPEPSDHRNKVIPEEANDSSPKPASASKSPVKNEDFLSTESGDFKVCGSENGDVKGRILSLSIGNMPEIPEEIQNISLHGGGYRYIVDKHISGDTNLVRVSIAIDPNYDIAKLSQAQIYYFDTTTNQWANRAPDNVDMVAFRIEGNVPANTDYFAGLIATPEMPEANAFVPTAVSGIKAANPAAGMNIMQPPSASRTGEAAISYPLDIPAGRQGIQPDLTLTYSSDKGTGWLGVGWDLNIPSISIDTRWGVPTFPSGTQEEVYLLNGKSLIEQGGKKGNRNPGTRNTGTVLFLENSEQSYKKIERKGNDPQSYYWVVTTADNTKYTYGSWTGTGVDNSAVLKDSNGNIVKWFLRRVEDRWGNHMNYNYSITQRNDPGSLKDDAWEVRITQIRYTRFGNNIGKYRVRFSYKSTLRKDGFVSLKSGVKVVDDLLLNKIIVDYDDSEIKDYKFEYTEGDFGKTLLTTIKENRNGSLFSKHSMEYYSGGLTYSPAKSLTYNVPFDDVFSDMPDEVKSMATPASSYITRSPINTSISYGWGLGGSVGLGIAPGFLPKNSKGFTFSGLLGYGETYNREKMFLDDMNGDGLPDLVLDKSDRIYFPLQDDGSGNLAFGYSKPINYTGRLHKSNNHTWHWGVDFTAPLNIYYYGLNWSKNTSTNHTYLTDYNDDGIKDLVTGQQVNFGQLSSTGDLSFSTSSENTPNPVLKGKEAIQPDEEDPLKDLEIVRVWEAPFDGTVNITGDAALTTSSADGISVGIQHNNSFLIAMTSLNSGSTAMSYSGLTVQKGDKLLFRTYSNTNGYSDFVTWNPQVTYQTLTNYSNSTKIDVNDVNYTSSSYEDGFLLSGGSGVTIKGDKAVKVAWPPLQGGPPMTDDVTFKIRVVMTDLSTGNEVSDETYEYTSPAGSPANIAGNFVDPANNQVADFVSSYNTLPSASANYQCQLSFEVSSNSNVDWKSINWRPEVQLGDDPCGTPRQTLYPSVYYNTYNRLISMEAPFTPTPSGGSSDKMRTWPQISTGGFEEAFSQDELNNGAVTKDAWFVTKTGGNLLSKMLVRLQSNGTLTFYKTPVPGQPLYQLNVNSSSAVYSFDRGDISGQSLYMGFYCQDKKLANFLKRAVAAVEVYNLSGGVNREASTLDFDVFCIDRTELQDYLLHWGQFCWSNQDNPVSYIDTADMHLDKSTAMDNDFSDGSTPTTTQMEDVINENSETPLDQTFGMLIPERGENNTRMPDYIFTNFGYGNEVWLDRWSAWGSYCAAYAHEGGTAPGKYGEPEQTPVTTPATGSYTAEAISLKTQSKTLAQSEAENPPDWKASFGESVFIENPLKFNTKTLTSFRDINGDGYPDILKNDKNNQSIQLTNSTGGFRNSGVAFSTFDVDATLGTSEKSGGGLTIAGHFANEDPRFQKTTSATGSMSEQTSSYEWIDINGDGLPDRVNESGNAVELNGGNGLTSAISLSLPGETSSKDLSVSLSAGYSVLDYDDEGDGGGFSAGIGLNNVASHTQSVYMDINGDGLPDLLQVSGSDIDVYINLGTSWESYTTLTGKDIDHSAANGIFANAAGTSSIPLAEFTGFNLKLALSGNAQGNFSVNKLKTAFRDINGDGVADYVDDSQSGALTVSYGQVGKSNLLKKVTNPLSGYFTIDYQRVGNKYGKYPVKVKVPSTKTDETMVWDMPNSKWTMSDLKINDGLDITDPSSGNDLDGEDEVEYTFAYDGGIKSRRERDFIGFTRVETIHEADPSSTNPLRYTSEVTEYARPLNNNTQYRRRFEYLKGLPVYHYSLYHEKGIEGGNPYDHIRLKARTKYTYEPRNIVQSVGNFGQVEYDGDDPVVVSWDNVSETQSIFPALIAKEEVTIPDWSDQDHFHALQYDIMYDKYMNVIRYSRKGSDVTSPPTETTIGTITNTQYQYSTQTYSYSDLYAGVAPFDNPSIDGATGNYCFTLTISGYEPKDWCIPSYEMDNSNSCSDPNAGGDNTDFEVEFRKVVTTTTDIKEKSFTTTWHAPIIATMSYFPYGSGSAYRTNALHRHKIFINTVDNAGFRRGASVVLNGTFKAPKQIYNLFKYDGSDSTVTNLTYDTYGNVISITGPENDQGQRLLTSFTYDTETESFVTNVSNSYGESSCSKYDYATGNLLKQVDINGHATAYTYDSFFRLKDVYGPREYEDASSAPTISFEYHPAGINSSSSDYRDKVPVAITRHNMDVSQDMNTSASAASCSSSDDFSSRPSIDANLDMETATFMDGMQRVVQVKKEAAKENNNVNDIHHEVSGITAYDYLGREKNTSLSVSEAGTATLGQLNTNKSSTLVTKKTYDIAYPERVKQTSTIRENASSYSIVNTNWSWVSNGAFTDPYFVVSKSGTQLDQQSYIDAEGNIVATVNAANTTYYKYDQLKQLLNTTDPVGEKTSYTYDALGRLVQESHPDRGISTFTYDNAGNLTKMKTPLTGSSGITYGYNYNRKTSQTVPFSTDAYNATFTWGTANDGKNGAGRIIEVRQGNTFNTEKYAYDELGNRISESREVWIPNAGLHGYITTFKYDSWGRMRHITYPDGEGVDYSYEPTGELNSISCAGPHNVIDQILYDGFGNIATMVYGNKTHTDFTYNTYSRRLHTVDLYTDDNSNLLDKVYQYDEKGFVSHVSNTAQAYVPSGFGSKLGGAYDYNYTYDDAGRLAGTAADFASKMSYSLEMTYNAAGAIMHKKQSLSGATSGSYDFEYTYDNVYSHQVDVIDDQKNGDQYNYSKYDAAGNILDYSKNGVTNFQLYQWNELGELSGVDNGSYGLTHYMYDIYGDRMLKGTLRQVSGSNNGEGGNGLYAMDAYVLYVNPYYVVTNYSTTEEGTKHYYMGSQRIASAQTSYAIVNDKMPKSFDPGSEETPGSIKDLSKTVDQLFDRKGLEPFSQDYEELLQPKDYSLFYPYEDYVNSIDQQGCKSDECHCAQSLYWATQDGFHCLSTKIMYWYHPDYLGNVEFVTNNNGKPHQFFWYSPWGEPLVQQYLGAGDFSSRYLFNAKELDEESGNYYYGARYYNPQTSIWLSVDPLAHKYLSLTPYNFTENNPLNLIDPTGMGSGWWGDFKSAIGGAWHSVTNVFHKTQETMSHVDLDEVVVTAKKEASEFYQGTVEGGDALREGLINTANDLADGDPEAWANLLKGAFNMGIGSGDRYYGPQSARDAGREAMAIIPAVLARGESGEEGIPLRDGMKVPSSKALEMGERFLGEGYSEPKPGSGRYVSKDGTRVFRMGTNDITGTHGGGNHVNFETLVPNPNKPGKMKVSENIHVFLSD